VDSHNLSQKWAPFILRVIAINEMVRRRVA